MIYEHNEKQQKTKKSQQDDTELWKLVSSRACKDWESWQDVYNMKESEMCHSHACLEHNSQADNNNKNTECNLQLYWDTEDEAELYSQSSIQIN